MWTLLNDFCKAHPRVLAVLERADVATGRNLQDAVIRAVERDGLRMQLRACGGRAPWYESTTALRRRLDRLARTGEV